MQNLVMCVDPKVDAERRVLVTENEIDYNEEISITINEDAILGKDCISEINYNEITLEEDLEINLNEDKIIVIYSKV